MNAFDWFLAAWFTLDAVATVESVGKARKPTTSSVAAIFVVIQAALIAALLISHGAIR